MATGRQRSTGPVLTRARGLPRRPRPALLLPYGPQAVPKPKTPSDCAPSARLDGARSPPGFDGSLGGAACFDSFCPSYRTAQRPHRDSSEGGSPARSLRAGVPALISTLEPGAPPRLRLPPLGDASARTAQKSAALRYRTRIASARPFPMLFSGARAQPGRRDLNRQTLGAWIACSLPPPGPARAGDRPRALRARLEYTSIMYYVVLHMKAVPRRARRTGASVHGTRRGATVRRLRAFLAGAVPPAAGGRCLYACRCPPRGAGAVY